MEEEQNIIENESDNYLLNNKNNKNIIDKEEDNNNNDFYKNEEIMDNKIINDIGTNYDNIPNWPKRSPFEYYNKNVIIPENYKIPSGDINYLEKNEKLNPINDDLNKYIHKNESQIDLNNDNSNNIKVSLITPNIKENNNNIILINPNIDRENNENIDNNNNILSNIKSSNTRKINQSNRDNNGNKEILEGKDIIYNFGYNKEDRLESLKLSLIKNTIGEYEIDNLLVFKNTNKKEHNDIKNIKNEYSKPEKNNKLSNNLIEEKVTSNINADRNNLELNNKNSEISKKEKQLEYYKEKDLFDEKIQEQGLNITQNQMNTLDVDSNKCYNYFKELSKRKEFEIIHPYLEYDRYNERLKYSHQSLDNHLTISQKNEIRQRRLKPILEKQKTIINDIINKKYNLNTQNSVNDINTKYKMSNSNLSVFRNNSVENSKKYGYYPLGKNKLNYRSYSLQDYNDKYKNNNMYNLGIGKIIGSEEWIKRKKLIDRKKQYSDFILFNEKKNMLEKNNTIQNSKSIKKITINEVKNKDINDNKDNYQINEKANIRFPLIKQKKIRKENNNYYNINEKKIYISPFYPLKKYKIKKETKEDKLNKIISRNPKLQLLFQNHNMFNINYENIKSHIK